MQAIVFLTLRSLFNGVKRALTSGRRLIGLIFVLGYYILAFVRPFDNDPNSFEGVALPPTMIPAAEQVEAVAFLALALLSLLLSVGMFTAKGGFKPADVDVLFPTPIEPATVLLFRMAREYLGTLLLPLVFLLLGWRGTAAGVRAFSEQYPTLAPQVFRSGILAYLLLSLAWVFLNTAIGLALNRSDVASDRTRKLFGWGYLLGVAALLGHCALFLRANPGFDGVVELSQSAVLRVACFPATMAAAIVNGAILNSPAWTIAGFGSLAALMVVAFRLCMAQTGWLYDQAAAQAFKVATAVDLQKKGDFMGMVAEQARQGKIKGATGRWYHRIRAQGGAALIWKELILQIRSALILNLLLSLFVVGLPVLALIGGDRPGSEATVGFLYLGLSGFSVFLFSLATAQTGFLEILRRVDLQKPLPFSPSTVVFWELLGKSCVALLPILAATVVGIGAKPANTPFALSGLLVFPTFALLIYAATFLTTILFPDIDDPTQRGFRSLMQLLGIAIVGAPGLGIFIGLLALERVTGIKVHPVAAAIPAGLLNLAIVGILSVIAGRLYAAYNPSE
jgi:hypothetical protein